MLKQSLRIVIMAANNDILVRGHVWCIMSSFRTVFAAANERIRDLKGRSINRTLHRNLEVLSTPTRGVQTAKP